MTSSELESKIRSIWKKQTHLVAEIEALTGHRMAASTISRMINGARQINILLAAYILLREEKGAPGTPVLPPQMSADDRDEH